MGTTPRKPRRLPLWQLALLGFVRAIQGLIAYPLQRMWRSPDPIDAYGLNHLTSVAGDALLAISLADSIFFHVPVADSRLRVALFLGLTVLPLALAGPLIVPILDRAGPRRSVTFAAAAGRSLLALFLAPQLDSNLLFPVVLLMLVLSKVHGLVKNGLTMAYASREEGLMRANARLGRIAVAGAIGAAPVGFLALRAFGGAGPIEAAALVYGTSALCTLRLPHPGKLADPSRSRRDVATRGRIPQLALPATGAIGIRAAGGFLLFLMAFALRDAEVAPWVFALIAGAGITGTFLADIVAPNLRTHTREEAVVIASVCSAGIGALVAAELFRVPLLAIYALTAGAASEFARLAFASLMQRHAPEGALGRVFVRYEVLFQGAWVAGAFVPVLLPISFRQGMVVLTVFYGTLAGTYVWRVRTRRRALRPRADRADGADGAEGPDGPDGPDPQPGGPPSAAPA
ncbi:MAG: MFS transporter [Actinobacteria bacterium]|nr:MAG: MFS transporter [Actinomycetota bacterium]